MEFPDFNERTLSNILTPLCDYKDIKYANLWPHLHSCGVHFKIPPPASILERTQEPLNGFS
jgi:hypothetical protein